MHPNASEEIKKIVCFYLDLRLDRSAFPLDLKLSACLARLSQVSFFVYLIKGTVPVDK
jgi:hypothetical protein